MSLSAVRGRSTSNEPSWTTESCGGSSVPLMNLLEPLCYRRRNVHRIISHECVSSSGWFNPKWTFLNHRVLDIAVFSTYSPSFDHSLCWFNLSESPRTTALQREECSSDNFISVSQQFGVVQPLVNLLEPLMSFSAVRGRPTSSEPSGTTEL